jgi:hypothetical protein
MAIRNKNAGGEGTDLFVPPRNVRLEKRTTRKSKQALEVLSSSLFFGDLSYKLCSHEAE